MATDDTEQLELARDLHDRGLIKDAYYRVYCLHRYGLTFWQIRQQLLEQQVADLEKRRQTDPRAGDKTFDEEAQRGHPVSTLQYWYKKAQRIIDKELDKQREGMPRLGVTGELNGQSTWLPDIVVMKVLKKTG